jgi:hypothetical protein
MLYLKKYLIFLENNNKKYNGSFIFNHNGWNINYSDRKGHYITDKLMERNKSTSSDPVSEINKLVCKFVNYVNNQNFNSNYIKLGVKFKHKKYIVIFEVDVKIKNIDLLTIRENVMSVRGDTIKIYL